MRISVRVKPNMKHREELTFDGNGNYLVYTKAKATEGKANEATNRLLAEYFGVSSSNVRLVRGHNARYKVFEIDTEAYNMYYEPK